MNADFTVKPAGPSAAAIFDRPGDAPPRGAIATELPAQKSVAQPGRGDVPRNDVAREQHRGAFAAEGERQSRQTLYDDRLAQVIYRVVDRETKRVLRQVPDQAMLRLRAYSRALQDAQDAAADQRRLLSDRQA